MVGQVSLERKELEVLIKDYYKKTNNEDVNVSIYLNKNKVGINLWRNQIISGSKSVRLKEELDDEDIENVLNELFKETSYCVDSLRAHKGWVKTCSDWDDGYYDVSSVDIGLKKQQVKQKVYVRSQGVRR